MKKHVTRSLRGNRFARRARKAVFYQPRGEQLEDRTLLAADVMYRLVITPTGSALPPDSPALVNNDPSTRFSAFGTPTLTVSGTGAPNSFTLSVYAQDVRIDPPQAHALSAHDDHGFAQAFLDVAYNAALVALTPGTQANNFTPGNRFTPDDGLFTPAGRPMGVVQGSVATPGLLDDVGVYVEFGDQLSPTEGQNSREMLLFRAPFMVTGAALNGANDDFSNTVSINEDAQNVLLNVLGNDSVGGLVTLAGSSAAFNADTKTQFVVASSTTTPGQQQTVNDPTGFSFTNGALNIVGATGLGLASNQAHPTISGAFLTANGGTISTSGGQVVYTPKKDFFGTDTFTYQLFNSDDPSPSRAVQTLTATVRVNAINDAPSLDIITPSSVGLQEGDPNVQTINLTGIGPGNSFEAGQTLTLFASSSNQGVVRNQDISLVRDQFDPTKATLSYKVTEHGNGNALITVSLQDNGGTASGGQNLIQRSFTVSVYGRNDAPEFTINSSPLQYPENSGSVLVDGSLLLSDIDSTTAPGATGSSISGATVTIGNYVAGQDSLKATAGSGITVTAFNATTGVLSLSGVATPAAYQAVLRTVMFTNSSPNPVGGDRIITFQAKDNGSPQLMATGSRTISVVTVNDAPLLKSATTTIPKYTERSATPVTVDASITITDADSIVLQSARAQITGLQDGDQLKLTAAATTFAQSNGVTVDMSTPGTLVFTSAGAPLSLSVYQTLLRGVQFCNLTNRNPGTSRQVAFTANDGGAQNAESLPLVRTVSITQVNDAPVLGTTSPANAAYTEREPGVFIDPNLTLEDVDGVTLKGAMVKITTGFQTGKDKLEFTPQAGILANTATAGTLTFTGVASLDAYLTLLRSVKFSSTSGAPGLTRTIAFTVVDTGTANHTATLNRTIDITQVNSAPLLAHLTANATYTERSATAATAAASLTITDPDSLVGVTDTLHSARVEILGLQAGDQLSFTNTNPAKFTVDASTPGVLEITSNGPARTLAEYQALLRTVKFSNLTNGNPGLSRQVAFTVNDGGAQDPLSLPLVRTVNIVQVNNAPILGTASAANTDYTEREPGVVVDSHLTLADVDGNMLKSATVKITTGFQSGKDQLTIDPALLQGTGVVVNTATAGTLNFTGVASHDTYLSFLQNVKFASTSGAPGLTRTIAFTVFDTGTANHTATLNRNINITQINSAPVLGPATAAAATYTENGTPAVISSTLTLIDEDNTTLAGAKVRITNFQPGDVLSVGASTTINSAYDGAGTLTFTSKPAPAAPTVATYLALLKTVKFSSTSDDPGTARTIEFTVNDGSAENADSNVLMRGLIVKPVNDAPKLTSVSPAATFIEKGPPVVVDGALNAADLDNPNWVSVTAKITTGYKSAEDRLAFMPTGNITGEFNLTTGTLTLTGSALVEEYQEALRSVTYENLSGNPTATNRVITFTANDGSLTTPTGTLPRTVSVVAVNDDPTINSVSNLELLEDAGKQVVNLSGISAGGQEKQTLRVTATSSNPTLIPNPVVALNATTGTATLTFTPAANKPGGDTAESAVITIKVEDAGLDNNLATTANNGMVVETFTITVTPVNDAPVLKSTLTTSPIYTEQAAPMVVDGRLSLTDVDNTTLASALVQITQGFQAGEDVLSFTPQAGLIGDYNATTGLLNIMNADPAAPVGLAAYLAALNSVKFASTSDNPGTVRQVAFVVDDGSNENATATLTRSVTVKPVNDAPIMGSGAGSSSTGGEAEVPAAGSANATYTEGGAPVLVAEHLTLEDVDSTTLRSAKVQITTGFQSGKDKLEFTPQPGLKVTTGAGLLTVANLSAAAPASLEAYLALLQSVRFSSTSDAPGVSRTVVFTVVDGVSPYPTVTLARTIDIIAVNDAPVLGTTSTTSPTYIERGAPVVIDARLTLTDADHTKLQSAQVRIADGFLAEQDVLTFTASTTINGAYDTATGILTLTNKNPAAPATLAAYLALLKSVKFSSTSNDPGITRSIVFSVHDGSSENATAELARSVIVRPLG